MTARTSRPRKRKAVRAACRCQVHGCPPARPGRLYGRTGGLFAESQPPAVPSPRYVRALGHAAGYADDERLARLERAGMPPAVASHVLTHSGVPT